MDALRYVQSDPARYVNVAMFLRAVARITSVVLVSVVAIDVFDARWEAVLVAASVMVVLDYVVVGVAPRTLGRQHAARIALVTAPFVYRLATVLSPLTKVLILHSFQYGDSHYVLPFFNLVRVHNTGAAFSFLAGASGWQRWFFVGLGVAAAVFIIWMLRRHGHQTQFAWALSLILGGAVGNIVDRLLHGYVVDFIQLHWAGWYYPSFNIADSAITIGAVLLIWDELRRVKRG